MNPFQRAYCRTFQTALKLALPFLPYRDPKIIERISDIPAVLKENGKKRPLVVTDQTIRKLALTQGLEKSLSEAEIEYAIFDGVVANPTTKTAEQALEVYRQNGCDCLIAFGGGSPMDCAKGVGALIARPKKSLNDLQGILKVGKKIPLLIAIPTTAGTGSETTLAAVIVDADTRHKYAINDFPLIPSYAVLDEEVTMTLPPHIVATTGMDALTHAIEAFIGRGGNASTRSDALTACKLIFENLESSYSTADRGARKQMLLASHLAGRAFSKAYVGYVHALAHALGGKYDVPHGLANAVILPIVLKEYAEAIDQKLKEIAVFCGLADRNVSHAEGAKLLITQIERLNAKFSIPERLSVIRECDLDELAGHAAREANPLYPVPVLWDKAKLKTLFKRVKGDSVPQADIPTILEGQRSYFKSGKTLDAAHRVKYLKALYSAIEERLPLIHEGLKKDLGKSESESYMCETGLVLSELSYIIKHVRRFAKPKKVKTPLAQFKSKSYRLPSPYGNVLVMTPWNYPFLLSLDPLIEAIAAGNTVTLKLSAYSPDTDEAIRQVIEAVFPPEYVSVLFGGAQVNAELIRSKFDYIFFTGSKRVGTLVYEEAAKRLTPVTMELGGKNPLILLKDFDVD
ncbi:MAG: iron-containing alcohol dehydrogenase, partial [Christensenellaceae bacterium]